MTISASWWSGTSLAIANLLLEAAGSGIEALVAEEVVERLPAAHEARRPSVDEHLRRQGLRIVVRGHAGGVGAGVVEAQEIPLADVRQRARIEAAVAILREHVRGLAQGPGDDLRRSGGSARPTDDRDLVPRAVQRRPDAAVA